MYLTAPDPSAGKMRLLVVSDEPWWVSSLESIFVPFGYTIARAVLEEPFPESPTVREAEAVLVHARKLDDRVVRLCSNLRSDPETGAITPVVLVSDEPLAREQRIRALRAGAWECLSPPLDAESLVLKIETFVASRRAAVRARESSLIDHATGLYNARGIMHWINELAHTAQRYQRPIGCAVFGLPVQREGTLRQSEPDQRTQRLAELFNLQARASDIVGRLSSSEFVVIAPETDQSGVRTMAARLIRVIGQEAQAPDSDYLPLSAGCYGVSDLASTRIEPVEIVARATTALRHVQDLGRGGEVQAYHESFSPN